MPSVAKLFSEASNVKVNPSEETTVIVQSLFNPESVAPVTLKTSPTETVIPTIAGISFNANVATAEVPVTTICEIVMSANVFFIRIVCVTKLSSIVNT